MKKTLCIVLVFAILTAGSMMVFAAEADAANNTVMIATPDPDEDY